MPFFYLLALIFLTIRFLFDIIFNLLFNKDFLPASCLFWSLKDLLLFLLFFLTLNLPVLLFVTNTLLLCNFIEAGSFGLLPLFLATVFFGMLASCSFSCFFFKIAFIPLTLATFCFLEIFFIVGEGLGFTAVFTTVSGALVS